MRRVLALCLCALGLAAGCAKEARIEGPERTLAAYLAALRAGDAEAAYALLDEDTRAAVRAEDFAATMRDNQAELEEQAQAIEAAAGSGLSAEARVATAHGETLVLVLEDGSWQVLGGVLDAPALVTPRDAVHALRHALGRRSLPGVLRVLSRGTRAELEAEMDRLLDDMEDDLGLDYEVQGNEAVVTTSTGRRIHLVREAGEWRVDEVE